MVNKQLHARLNALSGKNWGAELLDKTEKVDPTKSYRTAQGNRVVNISVAETGTFPVKGTIIVSEKPLRTKYEIWTLDGRSQIVPGHYRSHLDHPLNLIEQGVSEC